MTTVEAFQLLQSDQLAQDKITGYIVFQSKRQKYEVQYERKTHSSDKKPNL